MNLRLWGLGSVSLLALLAVPATAQASVGVGIQAGPVRLTGAAHAGSNYALPPVYVVNTGTLPESVFIRIERVSPGHGLTVPPSWIHAAGSTVTLAQGQSARIPLELAVPPTAKPGVYFSDVIVKGAAATSAGGANFDVAAATDLGFRVAPGAVSGPWFSVPTWVLLAMVAIFLLAASAALARRSGLRIRIEREPVAFERVRTGARLTRPGSRFLLPLLLAGVAGCGSGSAAAPAGAGNAASITLTLHTVSFIRAVDVNPPKGTFSGCQSGVGATHSTSTQLGYPNGVCWFGPPGTSASYPITILNKGVASSIDVYGSNAVPSDANGDQWALCNAGSHAAVTCTGRNGLPGVDQYRVVNSRPGARPNSAGLRDDPACDPEFSASGGCKAGHMESETEGIKLIGPTSPTDSISKTWTVTITWMPVPQ